MAIKGSLFRSADLDGREAATVEKGLEGENQSLLLNATGLQVTFLSEYSGLKNILLPWPAKGNYYLDSTDELQLGKYIYIEEAEGRWIIHSTKPAFFRNAQEQILYRAELTIELNGLLTSRSGVLRIMIFSIRILWFPYFIQRFAGKKESGRSGEIKEYMSIINGRRRQFLIPETVFLSLD